MNEAEKERLIKKDIKSIENRVRHAFNQGYEMGMKESRSEIPNTCGDAISRQAVLDILKDKWNMFSNANDAMQESIDTIEAIPSVTPEQKTGRWVIKDGKEQGYDIAGVKTWYTQIMCYKCGFNEWLPLHFEALDSYNGSMDFTYKGGQKEGGRKMTIQGAVYELEQMLLRTDIPDWVKPTIKKVIETIEDEFSDQQTESEGMNKWIPISERLPEDRTYVLTTIKIPNRIAHARSGWYKNGFFHIDNGDTWRATDMEVIAWMPLPEPYKTESEVKE